MELIAEVEQSAESGEAISPELAQAIDDYLEAHRYKVAQGRRRARDGGATTASIRCATCSARIQAEGHRPPHRAGRATVQSGGGARRAAGACRAGSPAGTTPSARRTRSCTSLHTGTRRCRRCPTREPWERRAGGDPVHLEFIVSREPLV